MSARKTKLRASCDACGAAKIKCDRGQPSCRRCLMKGTACIYGICRRTGKPGAGARTVEDASMSCGDDWLLDDAMRMPLDLDLLPTPRSSPSQPSATDSDTRRPLVSSSAMPEADSFAPFLHHQSFVPLVGSSSDFASDPEGATFFTKSDGLGELSSMPNPTSQQLPHQESVNMWAMLPDAEPIHLAGDKQHQKCSHEAYNILGDLILIQCRDEPNNESRRSTVNPDPPSLDQILHINRKSSERLRNLLRCSCIRSPGLAVVHALAIWRILQAYQQAADAVFQLSLRLAHRHDLIASDSNNMTLPSLPGAQSLLSEKDMSHVSEMISTSDATPSARISVGSFVIDDDQAKTALSIQLLSIEVQRLKSLVNLYICGGNVARTDLAFTDAADDLGENLRLWIRKEYTKTASFVKARSMRFCV